MGRIRAGHEGDDTCLAALYCTKEYTTMFQTGSYERFNERADSSEKPMTNMKKRYDVLLATFAISLLAPVAYCVAAVAGWMDWAAGLPAAVLALFVAWTSAIRINELTCSAAR
jgi:hypothetical protein